MDLERLINLWKKPCFPDGVSVIKPVSYSLICADLFFSLLGLLFGLEGVAILGSLTSPECARGWGKTVFLIAPKLDMSRSGGGGGGVGSVCGKGCVNGGGGGDGTTGVGAWEKDDVGCN